MAAVWGPTRVDLNPPEKLQEGEALVTLPSHLNGLELHRDILDLTFSPQIQQGPMGQARLQSHHCTHPVTQGWYLARYHLFTQTQNLWMPKYYWFNFPFPCF